MGTTNNWPIAMQSIRVPWGHEALANYGGSTATFNGSDPVYTITHQAQQSPEPVTDNPAFGFGGTALDPFGLLPDASSLIPDIMGPAQRDMLRQTIGESMIMLAFILLAILLIGLGVWTLVK